MADPTDLPAQVPVRPTALRAEYAPFVYFDGVLTYGVNFGAVQIELAANIIIPTGGSPPTKVEVVTTAHLRCSPNAIADLRQIIDKVLEMLQQAQQTPASAPGKLN